MVRAFALDNPALIKTGGRNASILDGISGLVATSLSRTKIAAAAFPDTLW
jgi:hypothetical protein